MSDEAETREQRRYDAWVRRHAEQGTTELIPAATVLILQDGADGLEVLMLRKNSKIAFGGMWVFPGGRIDDEDAVCGDDGQPDELATAARAAGREAAEEAHIAVDPDALVWFSHWVPPPITPKRFSTFFFATRAAPGSDGVVEIDDGEIVDHAWMTPAGAMARRDAGQIELAPPTWVSLNLLSAWTTVETALEALADLDPEFYETHIGRSDDGAVAMWSGDAGYETGDPSQDGPRHRLTMSDDGYAFQRTGC
ncbi:MAG: NUDIX domain-containing protein [Acidimicrobiales bacterium]|nr:NUDIX domain-containing protein [Acidimicrobiales bacterium]